VVKLIVSRRTSSFERQWEVVTAVWQLVLSQQHLQTKTCLTIGPA
jgi:hypothetical protein